MLASSVKVFLKRGVSVFLTCLRGGVYVFFGYLKQIQICMFCNWLILLPRPLTISSNEAWDGMGR